MDGQSTFLVDSYKIDTQKAPWKAVNSKGSRWKIIKDEDGSRIIVRCTLYSREELGEEA